MKRKENTSSHNKLAKSKSSHSGPKKSSKTKHRNKQPKQEQYFVLLDNQFYVASSKTERKTYNQFEQKVKTMPPKTQTQTMTTITETHENINTKEYISTLSKEEKRELLMKLEEELEVEKEEKMEEDIMATTEIQLRQLNAKIEHIKYQLEHQSEKQSFTINHLFQNEQISLEDKNQKIRLMELIKNNKIHMLDCASSLFQKIMKEETDINKEEQLEQVINSLNSLPSLQNIQNNVEEVVQAHQDFPFQSDLPLIANRSSSPYRREQEDFEIQRHLLNEEVHDCQTPVHQDAIEDKSQEELVIPPILTTSSPLFTKQQLKLSIREDEVQFGKDHYDDMEDEKKVELVKEKQQKDEENAFQSQAPAVSLAPTITPIQNQNPISLSIGQRNLQQEFLCNDEQSSDSKLKIPLLMTKQRKEQLEYEKANKEVEALNVALKTRHSYQVSEIPPEKDKHHFTTLMDVNTFVISFYQFVMKNYLKEVIEGLNLAFGKSAVDKIFHIRNEGFVPDYSYDNQNILPEKLLSQFHTEMTLNTRKVPDFEKQHNKAVFHAFNAGLNVYRPYYQLEGEVFPWNTSEKGLTFYEISEENIEEVFEKSKMKVLQYCASLCGMMPGCDVTTAEAIKILDKRNEQSSERLVKGETSQKFSDWYLKMLNFQALIRLQIEKQIWQHEMLLVLQDIEGLTQ